jgi:hypothetical protein
MTTIWKTVLEPTDIQDVDIPEGAEILCAREQYGRPCIWFRCDPNAPLKPRRIGIAGTGTPAPEKDRYLGTCSLMEGTLILHVFEETA